jgi:hypothetical protein
MPLSIDAIWVAVRRHGEYGRLSCVVGLFFPSTNIEGDSDSLERRFANLLQRAFGLSSVQ